MQTAFDWDEVNMLIAILNRQGVCYLMGSDLPRDEEEPDPVRLIQRLAGCGFPLVEDACISLFILHPELAPAVEKALQNSESELAECIAVLVLATLYMQQWWLFRLAFALGRLPSFPEAPFAALWEQRGLPAPSAGYGRDGLLALQEYQQRRYSLPINFLDDWQNQINHLLTQEQALYHQPSVDLEQTLRQLSMADIAQETKKERSA